MIKPQLGQWPVDKYPYHKEKNMHCLVCQHSEIDSMPTGIVGFVWDRMMGHEQHLGLSWSDFPRSQNLQCLRCGFSWLAHRFTEEQCRRHYHGYGQGSYLEQRVRYEGQHLAQLFQNYASQPVITARSQDLVRFLAQYGIAAADTRVLDYGGQGLTVSQAWLQAYAHSYSDQDPVQGVSAWQGQSVDLVICQQVLEHVMDPLAVFRDVVSSVQPGAWVYIDVPPEGRPRLQDYFHEHVNQFSLESLQYLSQGLIDVVACLDKDQVRRLLGRRQCSV